VGLVLGLIELAVCLGVFFLIGLRGWPGANDDCLDTQPNTCYCERLRTGKMVLQPINTWTNVGYMAVGLAILAVLPSLLGANPMAGPDLYSVGLGMVIIFLGPGSMFFHASMKAWGGWIDNISMNLFISWVALYDVFRLVHGSELLFSVAWLLVNGVIGAFLIAYLRKGYGKWVFAGLIGFYLLTSVLVALSVGGVHRDFGWLIVALAVFSVAFAIQQLSQTNRPLCFPDSWFQGHGLWHLMTALAAGSIFLYLLTET